MTHLSVLLDKRKSGHDRMTPQQYLAHVKRRDLARSEKNAYYRRVRAMVALHQKRR